MLFKSRARVHMVPKLDWVLASQLLSREREDHSW